MNEDRVRVAGMAKRSRRTISKPWAATLRPPQRFGVVGNTQSPGQLELMCELPDVALNPAGQLFGGFTAAYVDIASLYTAQSDVEGLPVSNPPSTCDWIISSDNPKPVSYR